MSKITKENKIGPKTRRNVTHVTLSSHNNGITFTFHVIIVYVCSEHNTYTHTVNAANVDENYTRPHRSRTACRTGYRPYMSEELTKLWRVVRTMYVRVCVCLTNCSKK